jgi:signal transduction histidine kinase
MFSSTNLMRNLMEDLIDYSQIKAGMFRKKLDVFDIRDTVEEVINT